MKASEEKWNRWIDEGLSAEQLDALRADHPGLEKEIRLARRIAADLRAHTPVSVEPPYPDFFNARVLKQIRDEQDTAATPSNAALSSEPWWRGLLQRGWMVPAAAALLAGLFVGKMLTGPSESRAAYSYSPESGVQAESLMVGNAVVVKLSGLQSLPAEMDVVWSSDWPLRFNQLEPFGDNSSTLPALAAAEGNRSDLVPVMHLLRHVAPTL